MEDKPASKELKETVRQCLKEHEKERENKPKEDE